LEDIRQIAIHAVGKLSEDRDVVGAFLFGSAVSGCLDEGSDIDICLVYDRSDIRRSREIKELGGVRLDICRYPVEKFARVFEDRGVRGKSDTWFDVSLWLGMMRGCEIIDDPHGMLRRWREATRKWSWRDDEVRPLQRLFLKNLSAAHLFIQQENILETLIFLREATSAAVYVRLMKENLVPYWDMRFLYQSIISSHKLSKMADIFRYVNDLYIIDAAPLRPLLKRLRFFVERDNEKHSGFITQFHNAIDGYWRHQYPISLLSARFSAFLLASKILAGSGVYIEPLEEIILDGGQHLKIIMKLKESARSFHDFYLKLLFVDRWNLKMLRDTLNALFSLDYNISSRSSTS